MSFSANRATNAPPRWAKWLGVLPLAVFLVATQVATHEEAQIFAAGNGVPTTSRPATLSLKGKVFNVTNDQRRIHQLSQDVAIVALASFFGCLMWIRRKGRQSESPVRV